MNTKYSKLNWPGKLMCHLDLRCSWSPDLRPVDRRLSLWKRVKAWPETTGRTWWQSRLLKSLHHIIVKPVWQFPSWTGSLGQRWDDRRQLYNLSVTERALVVIHISYADWMDICINSETFWEHPCDRSQSQLATRDWTSYLISIQTAMQILI